MTESGGWPLVCPECRGALERWRGGGAGCRECALEFPLVDGIWRFLPPRRLQVYSDFLRDYTSIRRAEGRGSEDPEHYLKLPACQPGHPISGQWKIRRRTFDCLRWSVLPRMGEGLRILDLGAGVGWLSHCLFALGHHPCSIELSVDDMDGLGAARHYRPKWPLCQAEFDHLPLPARSADVAIYNASLHYSLDYVTSLREALRVLRPGGWIVVLETPIYHREESGLAMVSERRTAFERRYGTRSEGLASQEFMTWKQLDGLGKELALRWRKVYPWYGWKWFLRPWRARLTGAREPARFTILQARKTRSSSV